MFTLKDLKNAPTYFDLIQIILKELVYSLLKSLILKFVKNVKGQCGDFKISDFNKEYTSSLRMI